MPGCHAYTDPLIVLGVPVFFSGVWGPVAFGVPKQQSLLNVTLYGQLFILDSKANARGLVSSNALKATIGW